MIAALVVLAVLLAAALSVCAVLLRRAYRKIGVKQARIDDLSALCDSQTEFVRDARPIHEATLAVRDETVALDKRMEARAEQARVVMNMLRAFLFKVIDRLDPEVAVVARRNVQTMLAQLPSLMPVVKPAPPPAGNAPGSVTA